jgi:hypothetical protein
LRKYLKLLDAGEDRYWTVQVLLVVQVLVVELNVKVLLVFFRELYPYQSEAFLSLPLYLYWHRQLN